MREAATVWGRRFVNRHGCRYRAAVRVGLSPVGVGTGYRAAVKVLRRLDGWRERKRQRKRYGYEYDVLIFHYFIFLSLFWPSMTSRY